MIRIIAVGRMKEGPERLLFERYLGRIRPRVELVEIASSRGNSVEIKRKDAAGILAACPARGKLIALDEGGTEPDSQVFATMLEKWLESGESVSFIIGGAEGLDSSIIDRAHTLIAFGRMTWPHQLVRILLAEQIYRARSISLGHPYHRAVRP